MPNKQQLTLLERMEQVLMRIELSRPSLLICQTEKRMTRGTFIPPFLALGLTTHFILNPEKKSAPPLSEYVFTVYHSDYPIDLASPLAFLS